MGGALCGSVREVSNGTDLSSGLSGESTNIWTGEHLQELSFVYSFVQLLRKCLKL